MMARRHSSPVLRRITAALADMCIRFEKRLSNLSATKETGYLHLPAVACDAAAGNWSQPGPVGALPEAEDGDEDAGEKQQWRRRAKVDLGLELEPVGPTWPGPTKFSSRKLLCRREDGGA